VANQPSVGALQLLQEKTLKFWTSRDLKWREVKKRAARTVFPTYSRLLDNLNYNARLAKWHRSQTAPELAHKHELYALICKDGAAIDYFEFGVHTGGTFRQWLELSTNPSSRFFGFDSFEGLPEHWSKNFTKGSFSTGGAIPSIDDARGKFIKGWFQNTLPEFLNSYDSKNRIVINIDCDLYSSSLFALATMDRFIKSGTVIIFDEFGGPLHEFRAFLDYSAAFMREMNCIGTAFAGEQVAFKVMK
jgi:O-methyltransferase